MTTVTDMSILRSLVTLRPAYHARVEWKSFVMHTVARYSRGNIAAQNASVLMPDEQADQSKLARLVAAKWRERAASVAR